LSPMENPYLKDRNCAAAQPAAQFLDLFLLLLYVDVDAGVHLGKLLSDVYRNPHSYIRYA